MLAQITSPYFTAGLIFENGVVTTAAPILDYMKGWSKERVESYSKKRHWVAVFHIDEEEVQEAP